MSVVADTYDRRLTASLGMVGALRDLFLLLWQAAPRVEAGSPLGALLAAPAVQQLRVFTVHDEEAAAWAASRVQSVLESSPAAHAGSAAVQCAVTEADTLLARQRRVFTSWGVQPGTVSRLSFDTRAALAAKMDNQRLDALLDKVGQLTRARGLWSPTSTRPQGREEHLDVDLSDRLADVLPSEYARLTSPALRREFYRQVSESALLTVSHRPEPVKTSALVVCVDVSASMQEPLAGHSRDGWAKATLLSLLTQALPGRRVTVLLFGSRRDQLVFDFDGLPDPQLLVEVVETSFGGGTDFWAALTTALDLVRADVRADAGTDIVFISDGECLLTPGQQMRLLADKQEFGVRIHGLAVGADGDTQWPFADDVTSLETLVLTSSTGVKIAATLSPRRGVEG